MIEKTTFFYNNKKGLLSLTFVITLLLTVFLPVHANFASASTEYSINYSMNNGDNNLSNPNTYTETDLPINITTPTKTGYEFLY